METPQKERQEVLRNMTEPVEHLYRSPFHQGTLLTISPHAKTHTTALH